MRTLAQIYYDIDKENSMESTTVKDLAAALDGNRGKIPVTFIMDMIAKSRVTHTHLTPNMRVCVIRTTDGHEVIGVAQVLDAANDVPEIGQEIAYKRASDELWAVYGSIAKVIGQM